MDDTEGYHIELTKKIIFTAKSPHRKTRQSKEILVSKSFQDTCLRLTNRILEGDFIIPPTPPIYRSNKYYMHSVHFENNCICVWMRF